MATSLLRKRMNYGIAVARSHGHTLSAVEEHHPQRGRILMAHCVVCGGGVMAEPLDNGWVGIAGNAFMRRCSAILASKRRAVLLREERKQAVAKDGRGKKRGSKPVARRAGNTKPSTR